MHHPTKIIVVAGIVGLIAGCSESPTKPDVEGQRGVPQFSLLQEQGPRRDDTPWRRMTDAELTAKVREANGRVFIGFKDPDASAGVDEAGRVLVNSTSVAAAKTQLRALGLEFEIEFIDMPTVVTRIPAGLAPQLRGNPLIEYIEPIFPGTYLAQTTTWNVQRVKAPEAWPSSTGAGAKLLITDSGIDNAHPDLAPAVVQSCESPPTNGIDQFGHGTAVAGIAAAVNNDIQGVGVAHGVALWSSEIGAFAPDPGYAACAVQFGRVNHVDVISMSITVQPSTALTDQINAAYNQDGIVIVVGAGSNGSPVTYPATLASAIAVSATDTNNNFAPFASGPKVELTAPGTTVTGQRGLTSTCLGGTSASTCGFGIVQGTSFSTPHVAAAAAILKAYHPSWTNVNIRNALKNTAVDLGAAGRDNQFGFGLIDIRAALDYVLPPPLSVTISGPTNVRPGATCTWFANPSGGTPPYVQYSWSPPGNNSPEFTYTNSGQPFNISVWVTDADGVLANDGHSVTVSPSAPICPF